MNNSLLNLRTLFSFPDPAATAAPSNQWQEFQNRLGSEIKTIKWGAAMPDLTSKVAELVNVELRIFWFLPGKRPKNFKKRWRNPGNRLKKSSCWTSQNMR